MLGVPRSARFAYRTPRALSSRYGTEVRSGEDDAQAPAARRHAEVRPAASDSERARAFTISR